jgi:chromosome segregation ATPase
MKEKNMNQELERNPQIAILPKKAPKNPIFIRTYDSRTEAALIEAFQGRCDRKEPKSHKLSTFFANKGETAKEITMFRSVESKRLELILDGSIMLEQSYKNRIRKLEKINSNQSEQLAQKDKQIRELEQTIKFQDEEITEKNKEIQSLTRELRFRNEHISSLESLQDWDSTDGDAICNSDRYGY